MAVSENLGDFWDGTVSITANKRIAATVLTQWARANNEIEGSMYRAVDVAEVQNYKTYLMPNVKKMWCGNCVDYGPQYTECSALLVQNIGTYDASITTTYYDRAGTYKFAHSETLGSDKGDGYNTCGGTGGTWQLPNDFEGHAIISSSQPLAVIQNNILPEYSATASTNAIPLY